MRGVVTAGVLLAVPLLVVLGLLPGGCATTCYDVPNALRPNELVPVDCTVDSEPHYAASVTSHQVTPGTEQIEFDLKCEDDSETCSRVRTTLLEAGRILSYNFLLKEQLLVDAFYGNVCKAYNECTDNPTVRIVAGATPTRNMPVKDTDGIVRLYPQALYRQLDFKSSQITKYDIQILINSEIEFAFLGDDIVDFNQVELLPNAVHELIHGLGFKSHWSDIRYPGALVPERQYSPDGTLFRESCFDRYITVANGTGRVSLLRYAGFEEAIPVNFREFSNTEQYRRAKSLYQLASEPRTFEFTIPEDRRPSGEIFEHIYLETSLSPYNAQSSVSHLDEETYAVGPDQLMNYVTQSGRRFANTTTNYLGPVTIAILKTMG